MKHLIRFARQQCRIIGRPLEMISMSANVTDADYQRAVSHADQAKSLCRYMIRHLVSDAQARIIAQHAGMPAALRDRDLLPDPPAVIRLKA